MKKLVEITKELQADHALQQLIKEYTRMVNVSGVFKGSTIDHMYTNVEHLFTTPEVIHVGDSDNDAPLVQKITRIVPENPSTIKKRMYRNFSEDTFLAELIDNDVNSQV